MLVFGEEKFFPFGERRGFKFFAGGSGIESGGEGFGVRAGAKLLQTGQCLKIKGGIFGADAVGEGFLNNGRGDEEKALIGSEKIGILGGREAGAFELTDALFDLVEQFVRASGEEVGERASGGQNIEGFVENFRLNDVVGGFVAVVKILGVVVDCFVGKAVKGVNRDFVSVLANQAGEAAAHVAGGGFGEGQTENAGRQGVGEAQNVRDAETEQFGFAGTRASDDQNGAFDGIDGEFLSGVEFFVAGGEKVGHGGILDEGGRMDNS